MRVAVKVNQDVVAGTGLEVGQSLEQQPQAVTDLTRDRNARWTHGNYEERLSSSGVVSIAHTHTAVAFLRQWSDRRDE